MYEIRSKEYAECPDCGVLLPVPPQVVIMGALKYVQNIHKKMPKTEAPTKLDILLLCPKCGGSSVLKKTTLNQGVEK